MYVLLNNYNMNDYQIICKPKILFFDINETILDTGSLKALLNDSFDEDVYNLWFSKLLHYSLVSTITKTFKSFRFIAIDALNAVSTLKGIDMSESASIKLIDTLSSLPAYPDVLESLQILKEKKYVIVALSNSSKDLLKNQLINAKVNYLFDKQISVEDFHKYKPHPEVYHKAASLLNVSKEECMLVAAHDWDVYGALCAGLRAVFIKRDRQCLYPLSIKPELEVTDLLSLAKEL